jgi:hypothetical protein
MATATLRRFSLAIDFIEPEPQAESPDQRAGALAEHDTAIRAAAARMIALLTSDAQIVSLLSAYGIQLQIGLTH